MREEHPDVKHYFDVWHVAEGEHMCHMHTCSSLICLVDTSQITMLHGFTRFP